MLRRRSSCRPAIALAMLASCAIGAAAAAAARPEAAAERVAVHHRIQLPGGSQLLLRREYRVIFRTPMRWGEGMLLERVYVVEREGGTRGLRAT